METCPDHGFVPRLPHPEHIPSRNSQVTQHIAKLARQSHVLKTEERQRERERIGPALLIQVDLGHVGDSGSMFKHVGFSPDVRPWSCCGAPGSTEVKMS